MRKTGKTAVIIAIACMVGLTAAGIARADFDLQFEHYIDDGSTPDRFNAIGDANDPNVLVGYDFIKDIFQPPAPPSGDYVQATSEPNGIPMGFRATKDGQPYDPNLIDNTWLFNLIAHDHPAFLGLTGTANFNLNDTNDLNDIPATALAIITRMDPNGTPDPNNDIPLQNYNLAITPNISWPVAAVEGLHANIELKVIDKCLRASRLAGDPNFVDSQDYAVFATGWEQTGPLASDINGNNTTDVSDLSILVDYWLCDCNLE